MIASVSKLFAGTAVLKLVEQGIISLDDDICNVVPDRYADSACRNPSWPNTPVTWRMLVTHSSSLRPDIPRVNGKDASYGPNGGYGGTAAGNPTCPLTDVVGFYTDFMTDKETETSVGSGLNVDWFQVATNNGGAWRNFQPGSRTLYSNFAVGYVAALIEFATGKSFPDYFQENILNPLGMETTAWFRRDLPQNALETLPVEYLGGNSFDHIDHYCFIDYASGSLRTTAKDMAKFLDSMLNYGAPKLWSTDTGKKALSCAEVGNPNGCEFGVNWILLEKGFAGDWGLEPVQNLNWSYAAGHDGAEYGSQTQVVVFPESGVYAVVFTNTDGNSDLAASKLMEVLVSKAPTLKPPPTPSPSSPAPTPNTPVPTPNTTPSPTPSPSAAPPPPDNTCSIIGKKWVCNKENGCSWNGFESGCRDALSTSECREFDRKKWRCKRIGCKWRNWKKKCIGRWN